MQETTRRRKLGSYYTPDDVARLIVRWALDGAAGRVLDPTFGGCSFLRASYEELSALGTAKPGKLIFGVDLDKEVVSYREELVKLGVPSSNLVLGNFFDVSPSIFGKFKAIVGNPPYIRHHWFGGAERYRALDAITPIDFEISSMSSSWAYFLIHALQFLEDGGRMGVLLPSSLLFTGYAHRLVSFLGMNFGSCHLVRLRERLFSSTEEQTVFVLASGKGEGPCSPTVTGIDSLTELSELISGDVTFSSQPYESWRVSALPERVRNLWESITADERTYELGEIADIRIGVVTGANDFFIRSIDDHLASLRGVSCQPIVTTSRWLADGLSWRPSDHVQLEREGTRARLLMIDPNTRIRGRLADEIYRAAEIGIPNRAHCAKREPWYAIAESIKPDAFLPYMAAEPRPLVLNRSDATSTNAVHRLYWKDSVRLSKKAVVAATWTSLFKLGVELAGRAYGGGVLKLEPSEAGTLPIPYFPDAQDIAAEIDSLVRGGQRGQAVDLANREILVEAMGLSETDVKQLRSAALRLSDSRKPVRSA